jgi:hypothetical protein
VMHLGRVSKASGAREPSPVARRSEPVINCGESG